MQVHNGYEGYLKSTELLGLWNLRGQRWPDALSSSELLSITAVLRWANFKPPERPLHGILSRLTLTSYFTDRCRLRLSAILVYYSEVHHEFIQLAPP